LCKLTSNSTQDAVLILFLYIFIFEMNLGMLLTSQGKVPLALDESKENLNMAQTGERLQNGDEAHKKINLLLIIGEKPNREEKVEGLGRCHLLVIFSIIILSIFAIIFLIFLSIFITLLIYVL